MKMKIFASDTPLSYKVFLLVIAISAIAWTGTLLVSRVVDVSPYSSEIALILTWATWVMGICVPWLIFDLVGHVRAKRQGGS